MGLSLLFEKLCFSVYTHSSMAILPWITYVSDDKLCSCLHLQVSKSLQHAFLCRFMSIHFNISQNKCHQDPIITVYWVDRKQAVKSLLGFSASIYEVHCKTKIHLIFISLAINVGIMILSTYFRINLTLLSPRIRRQGSLHSLDTNIVVSTHQCPIPLISLVSHSCIHSTSLGTIGNSRFVGLGLSYTIHAI